MFPARSWSPAPASTASQTPGAWTPSGGSAATCSPPRGTARSCGGWSLLLTLSNTQYRQVLLRRLASHHSGHSSLDWWCSHSPPTAWCNVNIVLHQRLVYFGSLACNRWYLSCRCIWSDFVLSQRDSTIKCSRRSHSEIVFNLWNNKYKLYHLNLEDYGFYGQCYPSDLSHVACDHGPKWSSESALISPKRTTFLQPWQFPIIGQISAQVKWNITNPPFAHYFRQLH